MWHFMKIRTSYPTGLTAAVANLKKKKLGEWCRSQIRHKAPTHILLLPAYSHYSPNLPDLPKHLKVCLNKCTPTTLGQKTQQSCVRTLQVPVVFCSAHFPPLCPSSPCKRWVSPGRPCRIRTLPLLPLAQILCSTAKSHAGCS